MPTYGQPVRNASRSCRDQRRWTLEPDFAIVDRRDVLLADLARELCVREYAGPVSPRLEEMASGLARMCANHPPSQRAQELLPYDLLRRLHATRLASAGGDGGGR